MHVQVCEYNHEWPVQFNDISNELRQILKNTSYNAIEHVGSTSVPGLTAKPVIDIDIITEQEHLQEAIDAFTQEGSYSFRGDLGIPERYAFKHNDENVMPKRNVYVCIDGCQALRNHLAVRDLCRRDAGVREKYGSAKLELSRKEWESVDEYASAKTEVLNWVLRKAGFEPGELDDIAEMNKKP